MLTVIGSQILHVMIARCNAMLVICNVYFTNIYRDSFIFFPHYYLKSIKEIDFLNIPDKQQ